MADHKPGYIFIIVMTFIFYIGTIMINTFSNFPIFQELGWYRSSTGNVSDEYFLEITPVGWTFGFIWGTIYTWQALWLIYGLSTLCRRNSSWNGYLYYDPAYMPITIYIFFSLNLIVNSAWIFIFDREYMGIALGLSIAIVLTVYVALGVSLKGLYITGPALLRMGHKREIGFVRALVHNGMGFYATWVSIATHLNLAIVLTYIVGLSQKDSSSIVLGMLGFFIIVYNLVDTMAIDKYSRYMITPYIVLLVALSGSLVGNNAPLERNFIITAVLLGLSAFALVFKLVVVCGRCRSNPEPLDRAENMAN